MPSINTNIAAIMAMRSLETSNRSLAEVRNRIATGLRIERASSDPTLWATAARLQSERKSLEGVLGTLDLGAAQVDTASKGLAKAIDTLGEMKATFTTMMQPGANLATLNGRLAELQEQLRTIAASAAIGGENWLDVRAGSIKRIVAGINTAGNGSISFDGIDIDTSEIALRIGTTGGLLQDASVILNGSLSSLTTLSNAVFDEAGDTYEFTIRVGSGAAQTLRIDRAAVLAVGNRNQTIDDPAEYLAIVRNLVAANPNLAGKVEVQSFNGTPQHILFVSRETVVLGAASFNAPSATTTDLSSGNIRAYTVAIAPQTYSVLSFNASIDASTLFAMPYVISWVEAITAKVTAAAAGLGAKANRIAAQQGLVQSRIDTLNKATGALVDADVGAEKTRLQALQVKQQLAIQALSIANASARSILDLFRR